MLFKLLFNLHMHVRTFHDFYIAKSIKIFQIYNFSFENALQSRTRSKPSWNVIFQLPLQKEKVRKQVIQLKRVHIVI